MLALNFSYVKWGNNIYLTLLFWITENLCTVPGMQCTFHANRCISSHFFKREIYVWHRTLMRLFPSQFLEPPVPNFLGARPAWIPPCCTLSPWGIGPGSSWGKLGSLPRQPGIAPRKCHLRIQPYHMDIRAFPLGIWSESEKLNFAAWLTTPQSVVDFFF